LIGEFYRVIFITHSPLNQKQIQVRSSPQHPSLPRIFFQFLHC
jgi:hypothetical protein